jgi:hypothetical protein
LRRAFFFHFCGAAQGAPAKIAACYFSLGLASIFL